MKAYDLKPSEDNLLSTLKNDTIGRNEDIFRFLRMLSTIEDSCSIALNGNWGSGKTFFVKQIKMLLEDINGSKSIFAEIGSTKLTADQIRILKSQKCIYYDAWENDNDKDPILSLVYAIIKGKNRFYATKDKLSFKELKLIKKLTQLFSANSSNIYISQIAKLLDISSPLDELEKSQKLKQKIDKFFDSNLSKRNQRLVIIIDELDRCKPSYAIQLLERIKHYFAHKKITFVFAVNLNELQHTVNNYYGNDFDGSRYLDRFFDLRMILPPPNLRRYYNSLKIDETQEPIDRTRNATITTLKLELREIAKFVRFIEIAKAEKKSLITDSQTNNPITIEFCLDYIVPVMIGLNMVSSQNYKDFIEGHDSSPLIRIVSEIRNQLYNDKLTPEIMEIYYFILNEGESFYSSQNNCTFIKYQDRFNELYTALFDTAFNDSKPLHYIGKLIIDCNTRDTLFRIAGLFSDFIQENLEQKNENMLRRFA